MNKYPLTATNTIATNPLQDAEDKIAELEDVELQLLLEIAELKAHIEAMDDKITDIRDMAGCQLRGEYPNELGGWSEVYSIACDAIDLCPEDIENLEKE